LALVLNDVWIERIRTAEGAFKSSSCLGRNTPSVWQSRGGEGRGERRRGEELKNVGLAVVEPLPNKCATPEFKPPYRKKKNH
jgi:hypothetical protein